MQGALAGSVREYEPDPVEEGLNALIERRAANAEHADDPEAREPSYLESVREYHEDRSELLRRLWVLHYRRLAASHRRISEENAARAAALEGAS